MIHLLTPLLLATAAQAAVPLPAPAPAAATAPDAASARAMVATLADMLEANFVDPEVARTYATLLRQRAASGAYDAMATPETLARQVTMELQALHRDLHLRVAPPRPRAAAAPDAAPPAPRARPAEIEQADWVAPGIAYIRFNVFLGEPEAMAQLRAFLDAHAEAKTLIIDARTHHGGGLDEMDLLFSRLYAKRTPVMLLETRAAAAPPEGSGFGKRDTLVRLPGPATLVRMQHSALPDAKATGLQRAQLFLLTSNVTGSAGEHLAMALKATHRATLIGETTGGAGNYGHPFPLPGGYSAFIPIGHSYFPGGDGWEGTGVAPDVAVPATDALVEALVRSGVARDQAVALDVTHRPALPMVRRKPSG